MIGIYSSLKGGVIMQSRILEGIEGCIMNVLMIMVKLCWICLLSPDVLLKQFESSLDGYIYGYLFGV